MKDPRSFAVTCGFVMLCSGTGVSFAQQATEDDEAELGWFNAAELSIVHTGGNSNTQTFGFRNTLRKVWPTARFRFKLDGLWSKTADDRFLLVDPGITFPPAGAPSDFTTSLIEPNLKPDVEQYFAEGRFDRDIGERFFWLAGGSWDRNRDAGILNRYIVFAGVGNTWRDREDLRFSTAYGVSYTDREETERDPDKDSRFGGLRLSWNYLNAFGAFTVYENDLTTNMSLKTASDYSLNMTNAFGLIMSQHFSLRLSLQWLFENEPALEDADVIARIITLDPDGIPGSGDEFFQTVSDSGAEITIGTGRVRKDRLDTIFRTALAIDF